MTRAIQFYAHVQGSYFCESEMTRAIGVRM
jgi:hypothetical protein